MNPKLDRKIFVAGLIGLASTAICRDLTDDAATLLGGIRVLRPRLVELDFFEGQIAMNRRQYREALQALRNVETSPTLWSNAKALMALCQYMLNDPDWRISVNDVLQRSDADPDAVAMALRVERGHGPNAQPDLAEPAEEAPPLVPPGFDAGFQHVFMHMRA